MSQFDFTPAVVTVETEDFGPVHLRPLTAEQYLASVIDDTGLGTASNMIAAALCDAAGGSIADSPTPEQVRRWPYRSFEPVSAAVLAMNGVEKKASQMDSDSPSPSPSDSTEQT